ncbi:MAG: hypothetical protein QG635_174 [Bacteroidota bacterium]|nr:hypothetical protein [Bacteroidota bacterium]
MKKFTLFSIILLMTGMSLNAQWKPGDDLTDTRDGKTYKTVIIGAQVWMAENLNIGTVINSTKQGSEMRNNQIIEKYCWDNTVGNCDGAGGKMKRGGFYEWEEALQHWTGSPQIPIQGLCPQGWHIPNIREWNDLFEKLGGTDACISKLQAGGSSGFNAHMTGYRCTMTGGFRPSAMSEEYRTYFWTSDEVDGTNANLVELGPSSLQVFYFYKSLGLCIRCLYDQPFQSSDPEIQLNMNSIDFSETNVGTSSNEPIQVINNGKADLQITKIEFEGDNDGVFSHDVSSLPLTLVPNQKQIVQVEFAPKEAKTYTAKIWFYSNDPKNSKIGADITANGVNTKPKAECAISQYIFGKTEVDSVNTSQEIVINNTGDGLLIIEDLEIENDASGVFRFTAVSTPINIEPGNSTKFRINFQPKEDKTYTANLKILTNDPDNHTINIPLSGEGAYLTNIKDVEPAETIELKANPNPFSKSTVISFKIPGNDLQHIELFIIDINGNVVSSLLNENSAKGIRSINFNHDNLASGKYYAIVKIGVHKYQLPLVIEK